MEYYCRRYCSVHIKYISILPSTKHHQGKINIINMRCTIDLESYVTHSSFAGLYSARGGVWDAIYFIKKYFSVSPLITFKSTSLGYLYWLLRPHYIFFQFKQCRVYVPTMSISLFYWQCNNTTVI